MLFQLCLLLIFLIFSNVAEEIISSDTPVDQIPSDTHNSTENNSTAKNSTDQFEEEEEHYNPWAITEKMPGSPNFRHLSLLFTPHASTDMKEWDVLSSIRGKTKYPHGLGVQTCFDSLPMFFRLWPTPISLYEKVQPIQSWNQELAQFFLAIRNESLPTRKPKDLFGAKNGWKSTAKILPVEKFNYFLPSISWANRQPALPASPNCNLDSTIACETSLSPTPNLPTTTMTTTTTGTEANPALIENSITALLHASEKAIASALSVKQSDVSVRLTDGWVNIDQPGHHQNPRANHHLNHLSSRNFQKSEPKNHTLEVVTDWTLLYVVQSNGKVKNMELVLNDPRIQATVLERGLFDTYDQRMYMHEGSMFIIPANIAYQMYVNYGNQSRIVLTLLIQSKTKILAQPLDSCYACPEVPAELQEPRSATGAPEPPPDEKIIHTSPTTLPTLTSTMILNGEQFAIPTSGERDPRNGESLYHWHRWSSPVLQYAFPKDKKGYINSCLTNYSLMMQEADDGIYLSNYGGYHSKTDIWERESTADKEHQLCLNAVRDYAYHAVSLYIQHTMYPIESQYPKNIGNDIAWQLDMTNAWINVNGKSHFNVPHIHPTTVISGVYYIDNGGDDCSSLYFDNPMHAPVHEFQYVGDDLTDNTKGYMDENDLAIRSVPGTYLIFPSWLQHYTLPHHCPSNSSEPEPTPTQFATSPSTTGCRRISIAFNVFVEKNQWGDTWCNKQELENHWCIIYPVRHTIPQQYEWEKHTQQQEQK